VTPAVVPAAIEFDRIVPASGNMTAAGRQIWLGTTMAGQTVTVWVSATTLHVFHRDQLIKTHPVTITPEDLAKLHARGRPRRPSPATALPTGDLPAEVTVEVDRQVNNCGMSPVAARLGHADPSITLRVYAHVINEQLVKAADIFAKQITAA
jgi:integrase